MEGNPLFARFPKILFVSIPFADFVSKRAADLGLHQTTRTCRGGLFYRAQLLTTAQSRSHSIPALVAGLVILTGLLVGVVLVRWETELDLGNDLSHFEGKSLSRTKLLVWIRYRYDGGQGGRNICLSANALSSDGRQYPDTVYGIAPVRIGEGRASVAITKRHGKAPGVSERVRVCLQEGTTGKPFYCETYPYNHSWSENLPGEPLGHNEIGGFSIPMDSKETVVRVAYAWVTTARTTFAWWPLPCKEAGCKYLAPTRSRSRSALDMVEQA